MRLAWLVLVLAMAAGPARAAITYTVESFADGSRFVIISGPIDSSDDLAPLRRLIEIERVRVATFISPGGNVVKAMELGRLIRAHGLMTVQLRSGECSSACALAFMGGVIRSAEPGSIGVHKASFSDTSQIGVADAVAAVQQLTAEEIGYMTEMGVDPGLLQLALQYDSNDVRYLSSSEMERYGVTTRGPDGPSAEAVPPAPSASPTPAAVASLPAGTEESTKTVSLAIPVPKTGKVLHPKNKASLRTAPEPKSWALRAVPNGTQVTIIRAKGDWFFLRSGLGEGYMHKTWLRIGEYEENSGLFRFIQVKSLDTLSEAEAFVRSAPIPLDVHLASNSWFAITLSGTFSESEALNLAGELKARGAIPEDSMVTLGNTYVRKVCCGPR